MFLSEIKKKLFEVKENYRINRNLKYIAKNKKKVLKKLRAKFSRGEKIIVGFYVYNDAKWKNRSVYDLLEKDERFIPYILVTKSRAGENNFDYQSEDEVHRVYNFFKNKGMRTVYAYDFELKAQIPFEKLNPRPDIIFYCHPWHVETSQGPVVCSKFALTFYSSYSIPASKGWQEYGLRFHRYVETQYVLNDSIKNFFSSNMENHGENLKVAGHPTLDYFYLNKDKNFENKNYVIYAPHFSVDETSLLKWGTFLEFGDFILEWAKKHSEFNWVFKPHPSLKGYLLNKKIKDEQYVANYWDEWSKIGQVCESGDYLDMFMESSALISDCGSFKTEYFMTGKPQIYLKSKNGVPFNASVEKICETCYIVQNKSELENVLNEVLIEGNDYLLNSRMQVYREYGYMNSYAAKNILDDWVKILEGDN